MRQHRDVMNSGARRSLTSPAPGGAGFPSGCRPPSRTRLVKRWTRRVGKRARAASGRSRAVPSTISPATCCSVRCSGTPASLVCLFVCLLINYNVAFDRINVMATINVRQRINVPKTEHVQAHTIKILGPTSKEPSAQITHTPNKMNPPRT